MATHATSSKKVKVGTTGWSVEDLEDPEIERKWEDGRYEIVEGVLTKMASADFDGGLALSRLKSVVWPYLDEHHDDSEFATGVDFIVDDKKIARVDMMLVTVADMKAQLLAAKQFPQRPNIRFGRWRVPPMLLIESLSTGHEFHDTDTKRAWYAKAGARHYGLLNAMKQELVCLRLEGSKYVLDAKGEGDAQIATSLFPRLIIPLAQLWKSIAE